jgi:hypothetical protein
MTTPRDLAAVYSQIVKILYSCFVVRKGEPSLESKEVTLHSMAYE